MDQCRKGLQRYPETAIMNTAAKRKEQKMEIRITETYNGWANRSTWLVNLWLDNDYGSYHAKCRKLVDHGKPITKTAAKSMAAELMVRSLIAQDGGKITEVNWQEIAEHWEIERQELLEYGH